jgi:predicted nuclease with TOPRIM domain
MNDDNMHRFSGEVQATIENINGNVKEIRDDIKQLLSFRAVTEERLHSGVDHFKTLDNRVECLEKIKFPSPTAVYAMIVIGFTVLGIIVAVK